MTKPFVAAALNAIDIERQAVEALSDRIDDDFIRA